MAEDQSRKPMTRDPTAVAYLGLIVLACLFVLARLIRDGTRKEK